MLTMLMETQIWGPPVPEGWMGEVLKKKKIALATILIPETAFPPALVLRPDGSVPPCMSLVLFELLLSAAAQSKCIY